MCWTVLDGSPPPSPSTSRLSIGRSGVRYRAKICAAASSSGRSILIFTSRRPGRRMAGSIRSSRLEAPMTMTSRSDSTPSISANNCGTIVGSMSELMPVPLVRKSDSISSKKTMTGIPSSAFSRARWKTWRIWRSVSPTYLLSSSGPLMLRKKLRTFLSPVFSATFLASEFATALAMSVLPQPGGQRVLGEEVAVQVGQLDGVGDGLDLAVQPAHVVVGDVGHLFEDELLGI